MLDSCKRGSDSRKCPETVFSGPAPRLTPPRAPTVAQSDDGRLSGLPVPGHPITLFESLITGDLLPTKSPRDGFRGLFALASRMPHPAASSVPARDRPHSQPPTADPGRSPSNEAPSLTLDQPHRDRPHRNQSRSQPIAHQSLSSTPSDPAPAPRRRLARDLENRLRRPLLRAPCPFAVATGQAALWVGPCVPPTRERVPDGNCFSVRRLSPEAFRLSTNRPRLANFPSGKIRGPGAIFRQLIAAAPSPTSLRAAPSRPSLDSTSSLSTAFISTNHTENYSPWFRHGASFRPASGC